MGIEPTSLAWKAKVLPLNYTRTSGTAQLAIEADPCIPDQVTICNQSAGDIDVNGGGGWIRPSVLRENGFTVRRL